MANYPPYQQPLLDRATGHVTKPWHLFFLSLAGGMIGGDDIDDGSVTLDKLQPIPSPRLLGRGSSGNGPVEIISLGTGLAMTGTVLSVTAGGVGGIESLGYWTPITNGDPLSPEILFDSNGDCIVGFVPTAGGIGSGGGGGSSLPAHAWTHEAGGSDELAVTALGGYPGSSTSFLRGDGTFASVPTPAHGGTIGIVFDGGGSVITPGIKGFFEVGVACTITAVTLLSTDAAATAGSLVADIWKDTYAAYPPVVADSLCASAKPTLAGANKSHDATLAGWTTAIAPGDILAFVVDSATTVTKVALTLTVQL